MIDSIEDDQTPLDGGGVPLPDASTREEGEISQSDQELHADFIRNAYTMITTELDIEPPRAEEDPRPRATRPLDRYEQC